MTGCCCIRTQHEKEELISFHYVLTALNTAVDFLCIFLLNAPFPEISNTAGWKLVSSMINAEQNFQLDTRQRSPGFDIMLLPLLLSLPFSCLFLWGCTKHFNQYYSSYGSLTLRSWNTTSALKQFQELLLSAFSPLSILWKEKVFSLPLPKCLASWMTPFTSSMSIWSWGDDRAFQQTWNVMLFQSIGSSGEIFKFTWAY